MEDGSVLVVEIRRGTLSRVTATGGVEVVATLGGGPNGAAIGPDGAVYVCNNGGFEWHQAGDYMLPGDQPGDYSGGRIERVDLGTGDVTTLYTECGGNPLRGPNDLVFDEHGGFWFTDFGKVRARDRDRGGLYYALPDGSSVREVIYPVDGPNGVGLSPDGSMLYYAETYTGRVWQRRVKGPGEVEPPGLADLLVGFPGAVFLDSLAVDSGGNVCVGTLGMTPGITVISPEGEYEVVSAGGAFFDPLVTNICFGGDDLRTAYWTCSSTGRLIAGDWPRPGLRLAF